MYLFKLKNVFVQTRSSGGVMIPWQERHIWPWQPLLQETEMVDGWSLGQLRQKFSLKKKEKTFKYSCFLGEMAHR